MQLQKVTAIITGGSNGLGKEFATRICRNGGKVLVADIDESNGLKLCSNLQRQYGSNCTSFVQFNVTNLDKFDNLFDLCESVFCTPANVLINNAGIADEPIFYTDDKPVTWRSVVDIDLVAVIRGTQVGLNRFKSTGSGLIINIASMAGLKPMENAPVYSAAKCGVIGLTRSCAHAIPNVRVNTICPSFADTALGQKALDSPELKHVLENIGGFVPIDRVTDAMVELIEDESKNGKALMVTARKTEYFKFSRL